MKQFGSVMKLYGLCVLFLMIANALMLQEAYSSTNAMTLKTITGQSPTYDFGQSVANAGDVNGDGYNDFVVGATYNGEGRVYIFLGSATVDTIPDVTLNHRMSNDRFGACVAGARDVNRDGYDDIIVGAQQSGPFGADSGHTYIFFGGATMDSVPDVIMAGLPSEFFGRSVAWAGDVNGDTYADVIVGANGSDAAGLDVGRAYIFFGGATVDNIPDVIITGTSSTENLGYSVASAGDANNDGYDDVIVGAYANDLAGGNNSGKAYLYLGGSTMNNVVDVTFNGSAAFDYLGICVAGAGDVNNDGYDDVLISAQENSGRGRTSLYLGGAVMNNVADLTLKGEGLNSNFGNSAASAGDINADGYADIIIGAFGYNSSTGKAYIYYGGASLDTIPDITFVGETLGGRFGASVSGARDVNGDSFDDFIIGAKFGGAASTGKAYLYLSSGGPLPIQLASFAATPIEQQRVRLDWRTLSELNNYGFEVQRKRNDQSEFVTLPNSFIAGHGTTNEPHSYSFIDSTSYPAQWSYRLKQIDLDATVHYSEPVGVTVLTSVGVDNHAIEFALNQNFPNPFNPTTSISYSLPEQSQVSLKVFDIVGREVVALVASVQPAGYHQALWDGRTNAGLQAGSGLYFYTIEVRSATWQQLFTAARKMMLLK